LAGDCVSFPLFLDTANDHDDEGVFRFHHRVTSDPVDAATPAASHIPRELGGLGTIELLTRLRAGDRDALTSIYDALFEPLWRVAMLQTHSSVASEDIVHDVFLWLWTHRERVDITTDIRVYLASATRNRARDLAKHRHVVERATLSMDNTYLSGLGESPRSADTALEAAEFLTAYRRALMLLSERELTAALLRWEEGFTLEQIGKVLAVSPRGAQGIVARAKDKLYDALKKFR
jgi:RNA polymerase sigma factor (sigma-70 family)